MESANADIPQHEASTATAALHHRSPSISSASSGSVTPQGRRAKRSLSNASHHGHGHGHAHAHGHHQPSSSCSSSAEGSHAAPRDHDDTTTTLTLAGVPMSAAASSAWVTATTATTSGSSGSGSSGSNGSSSSSNIGGSVSHASHAASHSRHVDGDTIATMVSAEVELQRQEHQRQQEQHQQNPPRQEQMHGMTAQQQQMQFMPSSSSSPQQQQQEQQKQPQQQHLHSHLQSQPQHADMTSPTLHAPASSSDKMDTTSAYTHPPDTHPYYGHDSSDAHTHHHYGQRTHHHHHQQHYKTTAMPIDEPHAASQQSVAGTAASSPAPTQPTLVDGFHQHRVHAQPATVYPVDVQSHPTHSDSDTAADVDVDAVSLVTPVQTAMPASASLPSMLPTKGGFSSVWAEHSALPSPSPPPTTTTTTTTTTTSSSGGGGSTTSTTFFGKPPHIVATTAAASGPYHPTRRRHVGGNAPRHSSDNYTSRSKAGTSRVSGRVDWATVIVDREMPGHASSASSPHTQHGEERRRRLANRQRMGAGAGAGTGQEAVTTPPTHRTEFHLQPVPPSKKRRLHANTAAGQEMQLHSNTMRAASEAASQASVTQQADASIVNDQEQFPPQATKVDGQVIKAISTQPTAASSSSSSSSSSSFAARPRPPARRSAAAAPADNLFAMAGAKSTALTRFLPRDGQPSATTPTQAQAQTPTLAATPVAPSPRPHVRPMAVPPTPHSGLAPITPTPYPPGHGHGHVHHTHGHSAQSLRGIALPWTSTTTRLKPTHLLQVTAVYQSARLFPRLRRSQSLPRLRPRMPSSLDKPAVHRHAFPDHLAKYFQFLQKPGTGVGSVPPLWATDQASIFKAANYADPDLMRRPTPRDPCFASVAAVTAAREKERHHVTGAGIRTIYTPPVQPPITRHTLRELDLVEILKNPMLRHDVVFDGNVQFRPNFDGERGRRKREACERYWIAVARELEQGCTCTSFDGPNVLPCTCPPGRSGPGARVAAAAAAAARTAAQTPSASTAAPPSSPAPPLPLSPSRVPSRIPALVQELRTICLSIIPVNIAAQDAISPFGVPQQVQVSSPSSATWSQGGGGSGGVAGSRRAGGTRMYLTAHHNLLSSALDPALIAQQLAHGVLDVAGLVTLVGKVLRVHCAPMRDDRIDRMIEAVRQGHVAQGIRMCFETLELMKLDIANHQLRTARPYLIESAFEFEAKWFRDQIQYGRVTLERTTAWFEASLRQALAALQQQQAGSGGNASEPTRTALVSNAFEEGFMRLIFDPPAEALCVPGGHGVGVVGTGGGGGGEGLRPLLSPLGNTSMSSSSLNHVFSAAYPETFQFDAYRLVTFHNDAIDLVVVYMALLLFRQLACSPAIAAQGQGCAPVTAHDARIIAPKAAALAARRVDAVKEEIWTLVNEANATVIVAAASAPAAARTGREEKPSKQGARGANETAATAAAAAAPAIPASGTTCGLKKLGDESWRRAMKDVMLHVAARAGAVWDEAAGEGPTSSTSGSTATSTSTATGLSRPPSTATLSLLDAWLARNFTADAPLLKLCLGRLRKVLHLLLSQKLRKAGSGSAARSLKTGTAAAASALAGSAPNTPSVALMAEMAGMTLLNPGRAAAMPSTPTPTAAPVLVQPHERKRVTPADEGEGPGGQAEAGDDGAGAAGAESSMDVDVSADSVGEPAGASSPRGAKRRKAQDGRTIPAPDPDVGDEDEDGDGNGNGEEETDGGSDAEISCDEDEDKDEEDEDDLLEDEDEELEGAACPKTAIGAAHARAPVVTLRIRPTAAAKLRFSRGHGHARKPSAAVCVNPTLPPTPTSASSSTPTPKATPRKSSCASIAELSQRKIKSMGSPVHRAFSAAAHAQGKVAPVAAPSPVHCPPPTSSPTSTSTSNSDTPPPSASVPAPVSPEEDLCAALTAAGLDPLREEVLLLGSRMVQVANNNVKTFRRLYERVLEGYEDAGAGAGAERAGA